MTKPKIRPPAEARHQWKSKSYKSTPVSSDVFEDSPTNRKRLDDCHAELLRLIAADPACPGRKVAA